MVAVSGERDELLERYETMRGELERLRVRANSPDLSVTVESGPGGGVISVSLSADAMRQSPETLSATITATIRAASGRAADATRQVVAPLAPDVDAVMSVAAGRLPAADLAGPPGRGTGRGTRSSSRSPATAEQDAEEDETDAGVPRG